MPRPTSTAPLLLVAASGFAREAAETARALGHTVVGCVDDDESRHGTDAAPGLPVLGGLDRAVSGSERLLVCAGRGVSRRALVARLEAAGVGDDRFATLLAPDVLVPPSCRVGAGTVLLSGTVLTADVTVGRHVLAMPHTVLTHDCRVADYATLAAGVLLGGGVVVGAAAYVGMGAAVREGVALGPGCTVGMGAVVLTDVAAETVVAGVPARPLTDR